MSAMTAAWTVVRQTWRGYMRHQCSQLAAAIAYYVLFSIVPLTILTVSVFGFVLENGSFRRELVDRILDVVPLTQTDGRQSVEHVLDNVKRASGPVAVLSLGLTLWTASSVFGSIRKSLNTIWGIEEHRSFARQKLIDFIQVGLLSVVLLASVVLTGVLRAARQVSADWFGPLANSNPLWEIPPYLVPALLSLATFLMLYHVVPARRPRWRDVIPGALLATLLFEALKNSFAFYVANFNNFDVVYGSLAGILLFLLYTYLGATILLIGAEVSHSLQQYHEGALAPAPALVPVPPPASAPPEQPRAVLHAARPGASAAPAAGLPHRAARAVRHLFARQ